MTAETTTQIKPAHTAFTGHEQTRRVQLAQGHSYGDKSLGLGALTQNAPVPSIHLYLQLLL